MLLLLKPQSNIRLLVGFYCVKDDKGGYLVQYTAKIDASSWLEVLSKYLILIVTLHGYLRYVFDEITVSGLFTSLLSLVLLLLF